MLRSYKFWNNVIGWLVWVVATVVFVSTAEKSGSWWDCGEYISTASKLMVGHPPGAPTFQILGCVFSLFAYGDPASIGHWVNIMSALCSSFTILFLFWSISMLAKKLVFNVFQEPKTKVSNDLNSSNYSPNLVQKILIFGAAAVGALAYTFTDSFWFSAAEGEVYAMSSFFTAITFWAILKWEVAANEPHNLRWIIFISFLIGLAIGVHLLNLLVIPAIVFIIYYKKYPHTRKGFWLSMLISVLLLAVILWGIVPWTVKLAGYLELFFVNNLHLPFNSGTIFFFVFLIVGLSLGLRYAIKKQKVVLHTALLCICFMLIGYSTFFTLVVRANANVPINQGETKDAISLLAYLNRDQYGTTPLLYGQYFNAPVTQVESVSPQYKREEQSGTYQPAGYSSQKITYDPSYCGLFPRMWSEQENGFRPCVTYYKYWSGTRGDKKPTLGENMRFLLRYQVGWMYGRYFMWNFVGRQNDIMGRGYNMDGSEDVFHGNWLSGIKFIDEMRLGPQDNLPDYLAQNPARNVFFFLPLLLGLAGLWYEYKHGRRDCFVVFLLFFMTGIAIVLYLNQPSTEPRERDYAFAGSFYAFAIWIGLGVVALGRALLKIMAKFHWPEFIKPMVLCLLVVVCLGLVPGIMACQGWDDHDRSHRTAARDFGRNILESCEPNAVLISDGDNDTFPIWYCQQVEGIRLDVRIINSMLANSPWLIQPLFTKVYQSDPFRFTLKKEDYGGGKNDILAVQDQLVSQVKLSDLLQFVGLPNPETKLRTQAGALVGYFPSRHVTLPVPRQELIATKKFTEQELATAPEQLEWTIQGNSIMKSNLLILDLLANNLWERPIYFISPYAHQAYLPSVEMSQMEGMVYRFVPFVRDNQKALGERRGNGINTERTYDLLMNKLQWGEINTGKVKLDPETRNWSEQARQQYATLAIALIYENKMDSAEKVLDKGIFYFPDAVLGYNTEMFRYLSLYYACGAKGKAEKLASRLVDIFEKRMLYVEQFPRKYQSSIQEEYQTSLQVLATVRQIGMQYGSPTLIQRVEKLLQTRVPRG
ncbi:MAG: DUF2723 domain-containing protein [Bacteroidales bacterium]